MKKFILMFLAAFLVIGQPAFSALSQHIVDCRIKARLVPAEKAVIGEQTLTWLNNSDLPVTELQFHLYLNAFKNNRSTFMKESGGTHRGFKMKKDEWGYSEVRKFKIKDGLDLTGIIRYIQPDDGNPDDRTVMKVELPEPVLPQEKITLEIEFTAKLPTAPSPSPITRKTCMNSPGRPARISWNSENPSGLLTPLWRPRSS